MLCDCVFVCVYVGMYEWGVEDVLLGVVGQDTQMGQLMLKAGGIPDSCFRHGWRTSRGLKADMCMLLCILWCMIFWGAH